MDKGLSLLEFLHYIGASTSNSRTLVEGEEVLNAGHIIMCGKTNCGANFVDICSLCLQSSALNTEPHKIDGSLVVENGKLKIKSMMCSCKAGAGRRCKHITAVLIKLTRENLSTLEQVSQTELKCIWNQQKADVKDKYKALPIEDMPCLKNKISLTNYNINEQDMLNYFINCLPDSAIAKHRKGRNTNTRTKKNYNDYNDLLNAKILDNCAQSVEMLELSTVNAEFQFDCCKNTVEITFNEDPNLAIALQQNSTEWHNCRKFRITGSRCYEIFTYKGGDWQMKASKYFWPKSLKNKYVEHGRIFEDNAISAFIAKTNFNIHRCGMIIPHNNSWMSFSPDGIVICDDKPVALLEVKCLYAGASATITEALTTCKFIYVENGKHVLKKKHKFYGQIQSGMAILNLKKSFLVLYASHDNSMKIIEVPFDECFIKEFLSTIKMNFFHYMIHIICENNCTDNI